MNKQAGIPTISPPPLSPDPYERLRDALRRGATPVNKPPQPEPDRKLMIRSAARSTQIVGRILDGISEHYSLSRKPAGLIVRIGRAFCVLVEAAIPRSIPNLLMHYWFTVLVIVESVMIAGGTVISGEQTVQSLGIKLLVFTLATRALIEVIRFYLVGRQVIRAVSIPVLVVAAVFIWWGTIHLREVVVPSTQKWFCLHTGRKDCDVKQETANAQKH